MPDPPRLYAFTFARLVRNHIVETQLLSFPSISAAEAACEQRNGFPGRPYSDPWIILDHDSHVE